MSPEQLQERQLFIDTLAKAGWQGGLVNEQFEQGLWVNFEASMRYRGEQMNLRLDHYAEDRSLEYYLDAKSGRGLHLSIQYGERLAPLLEAIISHQDTLTPTDFREQIRQLLDVVPEIFTVKGEGDKLVPLKR
jgi:hypothetical protein